MASNTGGSFHGGAAPYRSRCFYFHLVLIYFRNFGSGYFARAESHVAGFSSSFIFFFNWMIIVNDDYVCKSAMYFWVCREGLSTRPVASSDEIQLRIDPMHADFDDEITGLRSQVRKLRHV